MTFAGARVCRPAIGPLPGAGAQPPPLAGASPTRPSRIFFSIERIWSASGAAILFVTHDIAEAALLSERVIVLSGQPARIGLDRRVALPLEGRREDPGFAPLVTDIQEAL